MSKRKKVKINYLVGLDWSKFHPNSPDYKKYMRQAFEHARLEMKVSELRDQTLRWFKENDPQNYEGLELLEEWKFFIVGKYYWLLNTGATLHSDTISWLVGKMQPLLDEAKILAEKKRKHDAKATPFKKYEYTTEEEGQFLARNLEDLILDGSLAKNPDSAYSLLRKSEPKSAVLKSTVDQLNEFVQEALSFTKEEIEEGFSSQKTYKKSLDSYRLLLQTAETFGQNSRRVRKASRKKRAIGNKARKLAKVNENANFKANDTELKLVSIEPARLIGAKAALVYNTKTRKIGLYIASSPEKGFEVRGTTIHGYNNEKSLQKTLRKPTEQIESFRKVTQRRAEVVLHDYINAKAKPLNGRLNEHVVIMQVW